jgi:pimeloyl-ACP methyl ester carboxylesterase
LEIKEIRERCKKWLWKGQFSINYFVSCNSDSQPNPGPPLLLVHGFGASIPHWRRLVDF